MVEWLINKGARNFIATVDNFFVGPNTSHRMNRLLNQKKATIILSSSQKTETLQDVERLVHDANKIAPLEAVFFVSVVILIFDKLSHVTMKYSMYLSFIY